MSSPERISNSSFGCTSFGAFCFECNIPFGPSSFNHKALENHYVRRDKQIKHSIGAIKNKITMSKTIQNKIIELIPRSNEFIIVNSSTIRFACSNCGKTLSKKNNFIRHVKNHPMCSNAHFKETTMMKTTCGRVVLPPVHNHSMNSEVSSLKPEIKSLHNTVHNDSMNSEVSSLKAEIKSLQSLLETLKEENLFLKRKNDILEQKNRKRYIYIFDTNALWLTSIDTGVRRWPTTSSVHSNTPRGGLSSPHSFGNRTKTTTPSPIVRDQLKYYMEKYLADSTEPLQK